MTLLECCYLLMLFLVLFCAFVINLREDRIVALEDENDRLRAELAEANAHISRKDATINDHVCQIDVLTEEFLRLEERNERLEWMCIHCRGVLAGSMLLVGATVAPRGGSLPGAHTCLKRTC